MSSRLEVFARFYQYQFVWFFFNEEAIQEIFIFCNQYSLFSYRYSVDHFVRSFNFQFQVKCMNAIVAICSKDLLQGWRSCASIKNFMLL
jgi:hypothetical protein